jgi:hypothetical protein
MCKLNVMTTYLTNCVEMVYVTTQNMQLHCGKPNTYIDREKDHNNNSARTIDYTFLPVFFFVTITKHAIPHEM